MDGFVKQITETIKHLSDRSGREHYTKLFPEDVKLPDVLRGWLDRKDKKWLRKLYYEGYQKLEANKVWAELEQREPEVFQKLLRLFFPEPINLERVYKLLREWNPDHYPFDLIMLGRRVIEWKDEMLKYDEFYEDYMKFRTKWLPEDELKHIINKLISGGVVIHGFKIEPDGTYRYIVKPLPYFHYIPILLHAYIVYILRELFNEEERLERQRKEAVLFELFIKALLGEPLPDKKEIKRKLRRKRY
jgi:hypothetical protein